MATTVTEQGPSDRYQKPIRDYLGISPAVRSISAAAADGGIVIEKSRRTATAKHGSAKRAGQLARA